MILRRLVIAAFVVATVRIGAQAPSAVDASKIGPQVGVAVPPVSGTDQFGKSLTLTSVMGPKGAMLVFFRSADW